jgi:hypothetical protein
MERIREIEHEGQVDVRYWYFHPLHLSCRHRIARRNGQPIPER